MINQGAHRGYQSCAGVASQGVLEKSCDLGFTVAHMIPVLTLGQTLDDLTETAETQVDCLKLKHVLLIHDFFFAYFLAAC